MPDLLVTLLVYLAITAGILLIVSFAAAVVWVLRNPGGELELDRIDTRLDRDDAALDAVHDGLPCPEVDGCQRCRERLAAMDDGMREVWRVLPGLLLLLPAALALAAVRWLLHGRTPGR